MPINWNTLDQAARKALWDEATTPIFKVLTDVQQPDGTFKPEWKDHACVRQVEGTWLYRDRYEGFEPMTVATLKTHILQFHDSGERRAGVKRKR